jgi:predicted nucleotidyltransferase
MKIPSEAIADICQECSVKKLSLAGSFARGEEAPDSDVDLIVEFERRGSPLLQDMGTKEKFEKLFGREVDLIERQAIKNKGFMASVLEDAKVIYET